MDAQPRIEQFLTLEKTMQRLLDQLNQLREETESYSTAGQSLASATEHIDSLSKDLGSVAVDVQNAAVALREIGTPELLARHDGLQEQLNQLLTKLDDLRSEIEAAQQTSERNQTSTIKAIAGVDAFAQESKQSLGQLALTVTEAIEMLQNETATGREALNQEIQTIANTTGLVLDRVNATDMALRKQIRTLQIVVVVLTIVAVGAVSTLVVFL